jgi:SH3 domain-containing YSC84-like protein 1
MQMRWNRVCAIALALVFAATASWAESSKSDDKDTSDVVKRVQKATEVLNEIMAAPDKGIPLDVFASAKCVAVVPSMMKAGFVVGGRYGRGVATCRTASGKWSAPAPVTIAGGDWGLQIGGEAIDLVMLVMNEKGINELLSSKFKVGADASAAAGPVGRQAEGSTDWKMKSEILTYSRARGAFAGVTLNGAVVKQDDDATRILYGKAVSFADILNGKVPVPRGTEQFLAAVQKFAGEARAERSSVEDRH